ncbi:MAG: hypothetical protein ABI835_11725 [Chloroflexota bacterium]
MSRAIIFQILISQPKNAEYIVSVRVNSRFRGGNVTIPAMISSGIETLDSSATLAERLAGSPAGLGQRLLSTEFIYQPRPGFAEAAHRVFDFTLDSRLTELSRHNDVALLFVCDSPATVESLAHLPAQYPNLLMLAGLANPAPLAAHFGDSYAETPNHCGWDDPQHWRRYTVTDRWARISFALDVARQLPNGWLIMPAHDAVWGSGLLDHLIHLSQKYARNGLPAAVSPYTPQHHSPVPDVDIPPEIIDALNAAFSRDSLLRWRFWRGNYQAYWGKMGMIPFAICGALLDQVETMVWEDDLEIDRVLRELGCGVRACWVSNPALYRQALPVFDRAGLRAVIERTLHYSLSIPGDTSLLTRPLDLPGRLRRLIDPRFARGLALSEAVTAECQLKIAQRLDTVGASWVDWGAYRYVVRVGDPLVQVWKYEGVML